MPLETKYGTRIYVLLKGIVTHEYSIRIGHNIKRWKYSIDFVTAQNLIYSVTKILNSLSVL